MRGILSGITAVVRGVGVAASVAARKAFMTMFGVLLMACARVRLGIPLATETMDRNVGHNRFLTDGHKIQLEMSAGDFRREGFCKRSAVLAASGLQDIEVLDLDLAVRFDVEHAVANGCVAVRF